MQVVYLKLVSGENILTYVDSVDEEYVNVYKPIQIHIKNTTNGSVLRSSKWIPFTEQNNFPIKSRNVLIIATPAEDMIDYYHETLDVLDDIELNKDEKVEEDSFNAFYELYANTDIKVH